MRKSGILSFILFCIVISYPTLGQSTVQLAFQGGDDLRYTEKANLRIRENGRYTGYLYKEARAFLYLKEASLLTHGGTEYIYSGNVYVLEDQKKNNRQAKWIDESYEVVVGATDQGEYVTESVYPFPRARGFPVLSGEALLESDRWREYGSQMVVPREGGKATEIEFYCEYKYQGEGVYLERPVYVVSAQYATRYKRGQDPDGDPELVEASGKHIVTIYIDKNESGWMFARDQLDEQYRFVDGSIREIEGFYLTWYEGTAVSKSRDENMERLKTSLAADGVEDVSVDSTDEGVSISIRDVHFKPDQAELLPNEERRLDAIAEALKSTGDGTIKVVGHTADVGRPEGQYVLSVERAKAIIEEMVRRGIDAGRFIYEGRGGTEPIGSNDTEEGRAANRRVEFIILGS